MSFECRAVPILIITIPGTPVSVNHYVKHTRSGRHYVTAEAKQFKSSIVLLAAGRRVEARRYELEARIFLAAGQRGDGDNFWKIIADGLVEAKAIHSDAAVANWILYIRRDPANPRTEVTIRGLESKEVDGRPKNVTEPSEATNQ